MQSSQKLAKDILNKLKEKELAERKVNELNKEISMNIDTLYGTMEDEGIDSISIDGIKFEPKIESSFALNGEHKGKKWDDIGDFFDWLEKIGEHGLIKTKKSVHFGTRNKFLKEYVDEYGENKLPDFIKMSVFGTVKYNKSAVARLVDFEKSKEEIKTERKRIKNQSK